MTIDARHAEEIRAVHRLGEQIGYGNMMDIASALWANSLERDYGITSGAFIPTIAGMMKKKDGERAVERQKYKQTVCKEIGL